MDARSVSSDEESYLDQKVADTYGDIFVKKARDADSSRAGALDKLDESEVKVSQKYSSFLSAYLYDVRSSLERLHFPYDEQDRSFKARVELFLNTNLTNDARHTSTPQELHLFSHEQFPGYKEENVVFLKFPFAMVQRWGSGEELSCLQAPSLVQHYAVAISTSRSAPILDTTAYVKSYQGMMVWKHLEGMTFESENTLRHLLSPGKRLLNSTNTAHHIVQYLREHHVGLVSRFRVFPDFKDPHRFHYHGSVNKKRNVIGGGEGDEEGSVGDCRHSVCLVGKLSFANGVRYVLISYFLPYYYLLLQGTERCSGRDGRTTIFCCRIAGATRSSSRWTSAISAARGQWCILYANPRARYEPIYPQSAPM